MMKCCPKSGEMIDHRPVIGNEYMLKLIHVWYHAGESLCWPEELSALYVMSLSLAFTGAHVHVHVCSLY